MSKEKKEKYKGMTFWSLFEYQLIGVGLAESYQNYTMYQTASINIFNKNAISFVEDESLRQRGFIAGKSLIKIVRHPH